MGVIKNYGKVPPKTQYQPQGGPPMRKSILQLLEYGWPDKIIANYLMIKPTIVKYYRKKYAIARNEYQGFY
jgi:DNA-binding NarL/FixJ family response regulator